MARYVNRDDLEETFGKEYRRFVDLDSSQQYGFAEAIWVEKTLPDADVVEQRHGKWERHYIRPGVYEDLFWHCSACGGKFGDNYACMYHYCPNCGAKMITGNCDG